MKKIISNSMKKLASITLIGVLSCSMLVGCGNQEVKQEIGSSTNADVAGELTIFVSKRNKDLEFLADAYEISHPGVYITIDNGKSENTDLTQTEVLKNMNTALLNGNGPDIICFDGFSAEAYEDYLLDLTTIVEANEAACYSNVLRAYEENGQILQMPLRFTLAVAGSSQIDFSQVNSIAEMKSQLEQVEGQFDEDVFPNMIALWCRTYAAYVENTEGITVEDITEFYQFLDMIKSKSGTTYLHHSDMGIDNVLYNATERGEQYPSEREQMDLTYQYMASYFSIREYLTAYEEDGWKIYPITLDDNIYFEAEAVVGVNATSDNAELAKEFIEYAISFEGQDACNFFNIPVNREKVDEIQQDNKSFVGTGVYYTDDSGKEVNWKYIKVSEEMAEHYNEILESINTPICYNSVMIRFLVNPYVDYIDGKLTLQEAADTAMQKINLYQMEKE